MARPSGCMLLVLLGAGLVVILPLATWAWYLSDSDLRGLDAPDATGLGLPEEPPREPYTSALQGLLDRGWRQGGRAPAELRVPPGRPLPAGLAEFLAERPRESAELVRLAADGMDAGQQWRMPRPGAPEGRWAQRLVVGRVLAAPPADLPTAVAAAAVLAPALRQGRSDLDTLTAAVAWRLAGLAPAQAAAIATSMRGLRDGLWRYRADGAAELFTLLDHHLRFYRIDPPPESFAPDAWWRYLGAVQHGLTIRWNRAPVLRLMRDRWRAQVTATDPGDLLARLRALPGAADGPPWARRAIPTVRPEDLTLVRSLLALDVLLAELDAVASGAPVSPPADPFDPAHGPLRPVLRATAGGPALRIGWYSVGEDGRDDGGDATRDLGFATAAELGRGRFAEPAPP